MELEEELLYTKEHEWVSLDGNVATVGITDYAQEALGDITFAQLPAVDQEVEQFEEFASLESVKAASDIFSPLSGRVVEINEALESNPGLINKSCYDKGWLAKMELSNPDEQSNLMTAEEYRSFLESIE